MSNFKYSAGLRNVGSFQVSGMPFATSSIKCSNGPVVVKFPYVTQWVYIINKDSHRTVRIGFSENGVVGGHNQGGTGHDGGFFFDLRASGSREGEGGMTPVLPWKLTEIHISGSRNVDVVAGLTNIPPHHIDSGLNSPSGSNWSGSYDNIVNTWPGYGIG